MADLTCKEALQLLLDQVDFTRKACSPTDMVGACIPKEVFDKCHKAIYNELSPRQAIELLEQAKDHLWHTRCKEEDATQCPACGLEATIEMYLSKAKATNRVSSLDKVKTLLEDARDQFAHYASEFGHRNFTDRYGDADRCRGWVKRINNELKVMQDHRI